MHRKAKAGNKHRIEGTEQNGDIAFEKHARPFGETLLQHFVAMIEGTTRLDVWTSSAFWQTAKACGHTNRLRLVSTTEQRFTSRFPERTEGEGRDAPYMEALRVDL